MNSGGERGAQRTPSSHVVALVRLEPGSSNDSNRCNELEKTRDVRRAQAVRDTERQRWKESRSLSPSKRGISFA